MEELGGMVLGVAVVGFATLRYVWEEVPAGWGLVVAVFGLMPAHSARGTR